jgi:V-type H+-transporting ATPase subunit H
MRSFSAGNKEKVMRIALMMLERLINVGDLALEAAMVECGLPRIVRIRSAQSFADEDIPELLERLEDSLSTKVSAMSSLDKYRAEVLSGHLEWGPMHSSPQFWQVCCNAQEGHRVRRVFHSYN